MSVGWLVAGALVIATVVGMWAQSLRTAPPSVRRNGPAPVDRSAWPPWPGATRPSPTTTANRVPADPAAADDGAHAGHTDPAPAPASAEPDSGDRAGARPGRVFLAGDSVTLQAMLGQAGPGDGAPPDLQTASGIGWTAEQVQPDLDAAMTLAPPDTLVMALGLNDSAVTGGDGWTDADLLRVRGLVATPGPRACVVLVLPGHGPGVDPQWAQELAEVRMALVALAAERATAPWSGPTVVVDWQAEVDARPWLLDADGIHLATEPGTGRISREAAVARTTLYWEGVRHCVDDVDDG